MKNFKEIKDAEEQVRQAVEDAKRKGEERLAQIEQEEESNIEKMRLEIKDKRHQLLEGASQKAQKESESLILEADEEIKKIRAEEGVLKEAAGLAAEILISAQ